VRGGREAWVRVYMVWVQIGRLLVLPLYLLGCFLWGNNGGISLMSFTMGDAYLERKA
jgi:hypothetical protein